LTYVLQLHPQMTVDDVVALLPGDMLWRNEAVEHVPAYMDRLWSEIEAVRVIAFRQPGVGYRIANVYFDADDTIVGVFFSASSGKQLAHDDLRFLPHVRNGPGDRPTD
jgi:hypothetical protein